MAKQPNSLHCKSGCNIPQQYNNFSQMLEQYAYMSAPRDETSDYLQKF